MKFTISFKFTLELCVNFLLYIHVMFELSLWLMLIQCKNNLSIWQNEMKKKRIYASNLVPPPNKSFP